VASLLRVRRIRIPRKILIGPRAETRRPLERRRAASRASWCSRGKQRADISIDVSLTVERGQLGLGSLPSRGTQRRRALSARLDLRPPRSPGRIRTAPEYTYLAGGGHDHRNLALNQIGPGNEKNLEG